MKINILDIPAQGLKLDIKKEGSELQVIAEKADFLVLSPVIANIELFKTDNEVFVRGALIAAVKLRCARCLDDFEYKLKSKIEVSYSTERVSAVREKELTGEDININYLNGEEIDIDAVLLEQISLDLPMQIVCSPDCKGLCPKCGANLNKETCDCPSEEHVDQRFAKLKEIRLRKK